MKTNNSGRNRGRWDRPPVANEDDLAMAALLGEANSQEIQHQQQQQKRPQNNKSSRSSGSRWQQPNNAKAAGADDSNNYYGRASSSLDRKRIVEDDMDERDAKRSKSTPQQSTEDNDASEPAVDKQKADFGLSGALANDTQTGNIYNGIQLKFSEPPEARIPNTRWRLYVFRKKSPENTGDASKKDDGLLDTYHISRQSAYLFGRERKVADIAVDHPVSTLVLCYL
jgi:smad nuclear-interacting protein 1